MNPPFDPGSAAVGAAAVASVVSMTDIPKEAWITLAQNASDIVKDFLAPLTSTTSGLGRVISEKFTSKVELEKVLCADTLRRTQERLLASGKALQGSFDPSVVIPALDECGRQRDEEIREMWAAILAEELTEGGIHPELVRALSRLTKFEVEKLREISTAEYLMTMVLRRGENHDSAPAQFNFLLGDRNPNGSLRNHILVVTGLASQDKWGWMELTILGRRLLEIVDTKCDSSHT
ncbi:hypothetical protein [Haloferula sp. BvORR071]|uniref:Abi-alpha family protein n=1 Tax=Haloferula sp. BvORR071 TaxID=1396141 RepID=UPI002240EB47|nr:hypothetical protein [Haloferula sp. BvORR071]